MTDFNALLDRPAEDFKAPVPLPVGGYIATLGQPKYEKTQGKDGKEGTPYVEFPVVFSEPLPDVDQEALAASLGERAITDVPQKVTYYLTENAMYRLTEFLRDHVGIEAGIPVREQIQQAVGGQFVAVIDHTISKKDGKTVYANIASTAAVPS